MKTECLPETTKATELTTMKFSFRFGKVVASKKKLKRKRTVRSDSFIPLNKDFIQSYQLIDSIDDIQKDVFSALFRGGVGQMIFGNPGGVGGATIAKNRNDGYKIVDVQFRNGKRSLLRLDLKAWEVFLAESYCSPDYEPKPIVRPKLTKTFQIARSILALAMVIGIVWLVVRCTM